MFRSRAHLTERIINMKKIISLILAILCISTVLCSCSKKAEDASTTAANSPAAQGNNENAVYTSGDFNYMKLSDGTAKIVKYNKAESVGEVIVPDNVDGLKVTVIGENTFTQEQKLTSVRLPRYLTKVESYAFNKSTVANVLFNQITDNTELTIESYAFSECDSIRKVDFSKAVKRIEASAFYLGNTPRRILFTIDPEYIDINALDTGKNFDNLMLSHRGDISNYKNLKAFADAYGIEPVLSTVNAE